MYKIFLVCLLAIIIVFNIFVNCSIGTHFGFDNIFQLEQLEKILIFSGKFSNINLFLIAIILILIIANLIIDIIKKNKNKEIILKILILIMIGYFQMHFITFDRVFVIDSISSTENYAFLVEFELLSDIIAFISCVIMCIFQIKKLKCLISQKNEE